MPPQSTATTPTPSTTFEWIAWARTRGIKGIPQAVLVALTAYNATDQGCATFKVKDLAFDMDRSPRTVQRALQALADEGYLTIEGQGGRGCANTYQLIPRGVS